MRGLSQIMHITTHLEGVGHFKREFPHFWDWWDALLAVLSPVRGAKLQIQFETELEQRQICTRLLPLPLLSRTERALLVYLAKKLPASKPNTISIVFPTPLPESVRYLITDAEKFLYG